MNLTNQLPSFEAAFSNLHSSSLDLVEREQQPDNSEQQPTYQGMPVQVLNPFPIYNSQSVIHPNEADPLDQYSLALSLSETNYILNNDDLPELTPEEVDVYLGSDDTASDKLIFTEPDSHNAMHPPLRGSPCGETSVNISQSSLRPVALIRPLNAENQQEIQMETEGTVYSPLYMHQAISDNQATQAEVNVDDSPSLVERQRERKRERQRELRKDPAYAKRERERQRKLRKDPAYLEHERERQRERKRALRKDPAYLERERKLRKDPAYAKRERERQRERKRALRKDPAYVEHERERKRERERERKRERQRERKIELRKDPAYVERKREHKRERERERERERKRERKGSAKGCFAKIPPKGASQRSRQRALRKDPAYAEGQKIYNKIYMRIKRKTSSKEEAKKQAVIARDQYLQSVNSAKNPGDLPPPSDLAETTQSSSKNLDGTAPPPRFSAVKLKEYLQSNLSHSE